MRLPAILALAGLARVVGLGWGLPDGSHFFSYHPDEFSIAGTALGMLNAGDANPRFFHYGSLTIYLTVVTALPFHRLGLIGTVVGTHVVARMWGIAFGIATVWIVYRLGRRLAGERAAVVAALLVALAPGHVLHSAYAAVDVPAAFFVALTLWLAAIAGEGRAPKWFALAGATAGLAAATKYSVGVVAIAPIVAAARSPSDAAGRQRIVRVLVVVAAAGAAFLAATPFAVLDFPAFWEDVSYELFEHPREGHLNIFEGTGNGWWMHLGTNLPYVLGWPLLLASLFGLGRLARRRAPLDVLILSFAVPYFLMLGFSQVRFLRYTLPLVPVLALAATEGFGAVGRRWRRVAEVGVVASLALLTAGQQLSLLREDPRTAAAAWLARNAPPGASVGLVHFPWFYTPPVTPWNGGLDGRPRFVAEMKGGGGRYRFVLCEDWDTAKLERERPDWILLSEFEWREEERLGDPEASTFRSALSRHYREVSRFERFPAGARWIFGRRFAPHDWLYPFADVRIYRHRGGGTP